MSKNVQRIHKAAISLAGMMQDWPGMTWEDAQAVYKHSHWTYSEYRCDDLAMTEDLRMGAGRLSRRDLQEAWELARNIRGGRFS